MDPSVGTPGPPESQVFGEFRRWVTAEGGFIHPNIYFKLGSNGASVIAHTDIPADTTIMTCSLSMAITAPLSRNAISELVAEHGLKLPAEHTLASWSEKMLIRTYIVLNMIADSLGLLDRYPCLKHTPYIRTLPAIHLLQTPLHLNTSELQLLAGTNLHKSVEERAAEVRSDYRSCTELLSRSGIDELASAFSWERYAAASTYLSSRGFPSRLFDKETQSEASEYPILLPAVDSLNHKRATPVSWITVPRGDSSKAVTRDASSETPVVELVLHNPIAAGVEAFNNYGAKPNSELLLGYGFALADNPDDTIILQLGGSTRQWEVGRSHGGSADGDLEGLWEEIVSRVEESTVAADQEDDDEESVAIWESYMDAADMLGEMVEKLLAGLPAIPQPLGDPSCREPIREMIEYYVKGQRDILGSIKEFAIKKKESAIEIAREDGVELLFEDGD